MGYRGEPMPQMAMNEAIKRYAPIPSSSASAERSSTSLTSSASRSAKPTPPPYFPQSNNVAVTVVTRDANRIWQVASRLDERQFRDRQRVPPSSADQAQMKKLSIVAHVTRTLRANDADKGETAWEQRVVQRLTTAHDNYLRPMMNDLHAQCSARYSLRNLGNPRTVFSKSQSYPTHFKECPTAHALLCDDGFNGPMRPSV